MPDLDKKQQEVVDRIQSGTAKALCEGNPSWSPFFMETIGSIFDRPDVNGDIPYQKFYRFVNAMGTRGADREYPDKFGGWDTREAFYALNRDCPELIDKATSAAARYPDDNIDTILCKTLDFLSSPDMKYESDSYTRQTIQRAKLMYPDNAVLFRAQMTEGNEDAAKIYDSILYHAYEIDTEAAAEWRKTGGLGSHLMVGRMSLLGLDDMNIRGDQLVSAYEYCDNDMATLLSCIKQRDVRMVDYVNQQTALNPVEGLVGAPLAVTHGASFDGNSGILPYEQASLLIIKNIKPLKVDYAVREIHSGTSYDDAMKVLEANGFEKVFDRPIDVEHDAPWTKDKAVRCVIMHDPKTNAMLKAGAYQDGNEDKFCYSGCDMTVFTRTPSGEAPSRHLADDYQRNYVKGTDGNLAASTQLTYQGHLIRNYRNIKDTEVDASAVVKNPFVGFEHYPLPKLRDYHTEMISQTHTGSQDARDYLNDGDVPYHIQSVMDCLNLEKALEYMPENKRDLYKPFLDDKYNQTIKYSYFSNSPAKNSVAMGVAFRLAGTPESEIDKYFEAACHGGDRMSEGLRENYKKTMSRYGLKRDFYGESKEVQRFLDAFGLKPNQFDEPVADIDSRRVPDVPDTSNNQSHNQFNY